MKQPASQYTQHSIIRFFLIFALFLIHGVDDLAHGQSAPLVHVTGAPLILGADHPTLRAAIDAQRRHTSVLLSIPGVVGTAVGLGKGGEPVIRVYAVAHDIRGVPDRLDGIPVDVETTGMFFALSDPTVRFERPVPTGVSTGHPNVTAGTIGARVADSVGQVFALSNNHVYADENNAIIGDGVLQPGPADGGVDPEDRIGTLYDFEPLDFSGAENTIDAAIALSSVDLLSNSTPTDDGYGAPSLDPIQAAIGQDVQKYGRTTQFTYGQISEINVTVNVCYEGFLIFCFKWATFVDQIGIVPGEFAYGGDSGSLIVTDDGYKRPVGLLFAGSWTRILANPIDRVLDRFSIAIDGEEPTPSTDIVIRDIDVSDVAFTDDTVPVDVKVKNMGTFDVLDDLFVCLTDIPQEGGMAGAIADSPQILPGGLVAGDSEILTFHWDTTGASLGDHTLIAEHDFSDDNSDNDSYDVNVTLYEATVHIGNIVGGTSRVQDSSWTAWVILTAHDDLHASVAGATITGTWSGGIEGKRSCVTGTYGTCKISSREIPAREESVTFTVDDISHPFFTYDPSDNHDGDEEGGTTVIFERWTEGQGGPM